MSGQKRVICWLLERAISRNWYSSSHSCLKAKEGIFLCNNQKFIALCRDLLFLQYCWVRSTDNRPNYYVQLQKFRSHSYSLHSSVHSYKMPSAFSAHKIHLQIQTNISKAWVAFSKASLRLWSPGGNMLYERTYMCVHMLCVHTDLNTLFGFWSQSVKHCPSHLGSICVKRLPPGPTHSNNLFCFFV